MKCQPQTGGVTIQVRLEAPAAPVRVLYIAGAGRSGSTALEQLLASRASYAAVGEVRYLIRRGVQLNERCSCGEPFDQCPFWKRVMEAAFGGYPSAIEQFAIDLGYFLRLRRLPAVRWSLVRSHEQRVRLDRLHAAQTRVYRAIREMSGSDVVLDSSKIGPYGFLLAGNQQIDLSVMHLVRDARGVAYSWRRVRQRPEATTDVNTSMKRFTARQATIIWLVDNALAGALRRHRSAGALVRYEDVCRDDQTIWSLLRRLNLPTVTRESCARPGMFHSVAGSPSRLGRRSITLRLDDEWRRSMPRKEKLVVTCLAGLALVRYGYAAVRTRLSRIG